MTFKYPPESRPLDGFTIKRAIQRGGFGEVYFALSDAGKEVALKLLQSNFDIELRGVSQCLNLKHPNLLTIFDVKQNAVGEHWVVMEFMGGQTLDEILTAHPEGLPVEQVEHILEGLAAGVGYLHDQGLVHRDLKPANIYIEHGQVKIGDVGLSKLISTSRRSGHTESVGTVYYMAPEIAHGRYGHEIDVYALGVILFEMLTGKVPFDGETTGEILMKQLTQPPDLSVLPASARPVLQRALAKDPAHRTPSAQGLLSDYRGLVASSVAVPSSSRDEILVAELAPNQPQRVPVTVLVPPTQCFEPESRQAKPAQPEQQPTVAARFVPASQCFIRDDVDRYQDASNRRPLLDYSMALLLVTGFVLVVLWFISHSPTVWMRMGLFALTLTMSFLVVRTITVGVRRAFLLEPFDEGLRAREREAATRRALRLNEEYHRYRGPETRQLRLLDRLAEMTGSMAVSALCSGLLALALWGFEAFVKTPTHAAFFAFGTTLGCWAAIVPAKFYEGRGGDGVGRRMWSGCLGVLAGAVVCGLDDYLKIKLDIPTFEHIATAWAPKLDVSTRAAMSLQGYAMFFGVLLLARRWWYRVDAFRTCRVSLWSVIGTTAVAFVVASLSRIPPEWGTMWGLSISTIAQLSSLWVSTPKRQ